MWQLREGSRYANRGLRGAGGLGGFQIPQWAHHRTTGSGYSNMLLQGAGAGSSRYPDRHITG